MSVRLVVPVVAIVVAPLVLFLSVAPLCVFDEVDASDDPGLVMKNVAPQSEKPRKFVCGFRVCVRKMRHEQECVKMSMGCSGGGISSVSSVSSISSNNNNSSSNNLWVKFFGHT